MVDVTRPQLDQHASGDMTPAYGILGLFVVSVLVVILVRSARKKRALVPSTAELERDLHIETGIEKGELVKDPLTGDVYPTCVVCGERATERVPTSGVSWMDTLPLLNRLHSLAPRYVIEFREDVPLEMCKLHRQVAVKKLEEFHAVLRAERAQFNSAQEDKVAQMDGGALKRGLREHYQTVRPSLTLRAEPAPVPRLVAPAPAASAPMIVTSSSSKAKEDVA